MDYSIIIINYNLTLEVKNCIESLIENSRNINYELILVDNNSNDTLINDIADQFRMQLKERFLFVKSKENVGFGRACNLAAEKANGKVLCFINPDTIFSNNLLHELILNGFFDKLNRNNSITGLNVSDNRFYDFSAGYFPNIFFELLNIFLLGRLAEAFYISSVAKFFFNRNLKVDWVMGAALFIGRELFEKVRGFDKDYFLYFEEMDLCKKVIDAGGKVIYLPSIKLHHIGSVSSKKNYYYFTKMFYKGKLLFYNKHFTGSKKYVLKKLLFLHFLSQIVLWTLLKYYSPLKALGKLSAFRELINNIDKPDRLSNNTLV